MMKNTIKALVLLYTAFAINSAFAVGGGIGSVPGFSVTDPYANLDGTTSTFTTSVKDLGGPIAYNSDTKQLQVIDATTGQLKLYADGASTPSATKTLYTGSPLTSVGIYYSRVSKYTTIVGLTQGTAGYSFPSDGGSFTANNGDIVILKINASGDLIDYSYVQKKTGTSFVNPNMNESTNSAGGRYIYIGGSIDGKGILFEIESSTGDISRIVQFSSTTKAYSAIPMATAGHVLVSAKFDATHGGNNALLDWNTSTNTFDSQLDLTNTDNVYDMTVLNATTGHVLVDFTATNAKVGVQNLTNAGGQNSAVITINLSNNTPSGILNFGQTSANNVKLTKLMPTATSEQFLYANGSYTGNGFDANGTAYVTDTQSTTGQDGVIVEMNTPSGASASTALHYVSHLASGNNEFSYSTRGDALGTFYALDTNGYVYKFSDLSNANGNCPAGKEPVQVPYKYNTTLGTISNYGDQAAVQAFLSATYSGGTVGNDTNAPAEITRTTGTFNGFTSEPSYILNYGFSVQGNTEEYFGGFAFNRSDTMGWAGQSIQQVKTTILDTLAGSDQTAKDVLVNVLKTNLKDNASLSTTISPNLGSYRNYYAGKGIDITIIDGSNPYYYVDFYNPDTADRAKLNAGTYSSYYLSARGVNNSKWFKDLDPKNASAGSTIGANDIVWSPLNRGGIYISDSEFPQLMFPIKKKSDNSVEAFVEFACGNLVCHDYTKECLSPSISTKEVNNCGNGTLDSGEQCEKTGQIIPSEITSALPWYTYSCSNTCKVQATPSPSLSTSSTEQIVYITQCRPTTPPPPGCNPATDSACAICGNTVIEAGEQCEIGVGGKTAQTCSQYTCQNIATSNDCSITNIFGNVRYDQGQECSPDPLNPAYDVNCSDGINFPTTVACHINRPSSCGDGKIDLTPTDRPSESCDFGTDNQGGNTWNAGDENNVLKTKAGVQCSNVCQEIRPIPTENVCGNNVLELTNGEQCEIASNGSIIWDQVIIDQATGSGYADPTAAGWVCSGTGGTSQCKAGIPPVCGNNRLDMNEECDGGANCYTASGASAPPAGFESLQCTFGKCGNGVVETSIGEQCEPATDGTSCDAVSCRWVGSGSTWPTTPVECKEDVAFQKTYNFLTFNSKTFNGVYELWTWNGAKFTKQKIAYPTGSDILAHTTENATATVNLKTYMANEFVSKLIDGKLIVPKERVFNAKNRYLDSMALQSVFFDANKVIGGGYIRTGFSFLTDFYDDGMKMEIQALKCTDDTVVTKQAVTNVIGVIDTESQGIYLIKAWGTALPEYTDFWKDRSLGDSGTQ